MARLQKRITDISNKVGKRILKLFGFDVEEKTNIYPDKSLIDEVNKIQNKLVVDDPNNYRIVPDDKTMDALKWS